MVTLYDVEKVMEIHDYNVKQRGIEKGICAFVAGLSDLSIDKQVAAQGLVEHFGLSPLAAEEKVELYWGR